MKIKKFAGRGLLVLAVLMSQTGFAEGWYMGLSLGLSDLDSDVESDITEALNIDESEDTFSSPITFSRLLDIGAPAGKLYGGKKIHKHLALEGGYLDLGEVVDLAVRFDEFSLGNLLFLSGDEELRTSIAVDGFYFSAIGHLPLNNVVSLHATGGVYLWQLKQKVVLSNDDAGIRISDSDTSSSGDLFLGVGMNIGRFGLQYQVYDVDGTDTEYFGASIQHRF